MVGIGNKTEDEADLEIEIRVDSAVLRARDRVEIEIALVKDAVGVKGGAGVETEIVALNQLNQGAVVYTGHILCTG